MAVPSTSDGQNRTIQAKLHDNIVEIGSLSRQLMVSLSGNGKSVLNTKEILQTIASRDKEIQRLAVTAMEMSSCQREMASIEEELEKRHQEVYQLQTNLQEAERIIELAVYKGRQRLDAIEQAEKGAVSPEDLIRYAHRISQASSVVSPVGWQLSDPRRPFPQDIEMRCGVLGQLTVGYKPPTSKPHPQTTSNGAILPPPEKKFALAGMNQNLNNCENGGVAQQLDLMVQSADAPVAEAATEAEAEPEPMSEDSSPSSDEDS